ncbi:MAG: DUF58 domain-containing protein [Planctomycetota bacterium]
MNANDPIDSGDEGISVPGAVASLTGVAALVLSSSDEVAFRLPLPAQFLLAGGGGGLFAWGLTELGESLLRLGRVGGRARPRWTRWSLSGTAMIGFAVALGACFRVQLAAAVAGLLFLGGIGLTWFGRAVADRRLAEGRPLLAEKLLVSITPAGLATLGAAVLLLVAAFLGPSNMLLLVGTLLLGPFVFSGSYTFLSLANLKVRRVVPAECVAGEPLAVGVEITNIGRFPAAWLIDVADVIEDRYGTATARATLARVDARRTSSTRYRVRPMIRGPLTLGPLRLSSRFPLGMTERAKIFGTKDRLLVLPRVGQLTPAWRRDVMRADELVHRPTTRRGVFDDEFHQIREYRHGDSPKSIHWRTSARQSALMVREYHESRDRDLLILLDLKSDDPDGLPDAEVELAISFAATVAFAHLTAAAGSRLTIATTDRRTPRFDAIATPGGRRAVLRFLANVRAARAPAVSRLWTVAEAAHAGVTFGLLLSTRPSVDPITTPDRMAWVRLFRTEQVRKFIRFPDPESARRPAVAEAP